MHISNQLITWQQLNPFRHVDMVKDNLLKFKPSIRMGKKCDLSDFEHGIAVGARLAGLSISEAADRLSYSHTTISRVYREWSEKRRKYPVSCGSLGEYALLMAEVQGEWPADSS